MEFRFYRLRFLFSAQDSLYFPPRKTGNVLRGAFGSIFRSIACVPDCVDARTCERRAECAYARTFEPASAGGGPSGFSDWPRPFAFRASHLDGRRVRPGEAFHFDVHVFQLREPAIPYFVLAFAQLAQEGLGRGRGRAVLTRVEQLDTSGEVVRQLFNGAALCGAGEVAPSALSLDAGDSAVSQVVVRFLTPTELKSGQEVTRQPDFAVLMGRIRDRLSTLGALYGDGPLDMDFAEFGRRAATVRTIRMDLEDVEVFRLSSRTGQRHSIGGFVGVVEYAGRLGEFLPFIEAARFSGVGRHAAWGKGELEVTECTYGASDTDSASP